MTRPFVLPYALLACAALAAAIGLAVRQFGALPAVTADSTLPLLLDLLLTTVPFVAARAVHSRCTRRETRRSHVTLATSAGLLGMLAAWAPLGTAVWQVDGMAAQLLDAVRWAGIAFVLVYAPRWGLLDVVGLRAAWRQARGLPQETVSRSIGDLARHPAVMGVLAIAWAAPVMTADRLVVVAVGTGAILARFVADEIGSIRAHSRRTDPDAPSDVASELSPIERRRYVLEHDTRRRADRRRHEPAVIARERPQRVDVRRETTGDGRLAKVS